MFIDFLAIKNFFVFSKFIFLPYFETFADLKISVKVFNPLKMSNCELYKLYHIVSRLCTEPKKGFKFGNFRNFS